MRRPSGLLALLLVVVGCTGEPGAAPRPVDIKLSLILNQQSDWYAGAKRFEELAEAATEGRYDVRIYTGAALSNANQRTELEMVQSGVLQASLESSILLSLTDPRFSVFSLPWLFPDHATANAVCDGPLGETMLAVLPENELVGLAFGVNGFRQLTNSRGPVRTPQDIDRMKVRVPAIKMYISLFQLLGADPSSMNFGELLPALRSGAMDAQENPLSVIWGSKLYEVQDHLTLWNYSYDPIVLCFNKSFFEGLPPADQVALRAAARDAMAYERELVAEHDVELVEQLRAAGMRVVPTAEVDLAAFRQAVAPLFDEYGPIIGVDLMEAFRAAGRAGAAPSAG